jgi:hypothetical protein
MAAAAQELKIMLNAATKPRKYRGGSSLSQSRFFESASPNPLPLSLKFSKT